MPLYPLSARTDGARLSPCPRNTPRHERLSPCHPSAWRAERSPSRPPPRVRAHVPSRPCPPPLRPQIAARWNKFLHVRSFSLVTSVGPVSARASPADSAESMRRGAVKLVDYTPVRFYSLHCQSSMGRPRPDAHVQVPILPQLHETCWRLTILPQTWARCAPRQAGQLCLDIPPGLLIGFRVTFSFPQVCARWTPCVHVRQAVLPGWMGRGICWSNLGDQPLRHDMIGGGKTRLSPGLPNVRQAMFGGSYTAAAPSPGLSQG